MDLHEALRAALLGRRGPQPPPRRRLMKAQGGAPASPVRGEGVDVGVAIVDLGRRLDVRGPRAGVEQLVDAVAVRGRRDGEHADGALRRRAPEHLLQRAGDGEAGVGLRQGVHAELDGRGGVSAGPVDEVREEAADDVREVEEAEHLQHGLVAAGVLCAVVLVQEEEALLGRVPDDLLHERRGEVVKVEEGPQQLGHGARVEDSSARLAGCRERCCVSGVSSLTGARAHEEELGYCRCCSRSLISSRAIPSSRPQICRISVARHRQSPGRSWSRTSSLRRR